MKSEVQLLRDVLNTADYELFQKTVAHEMVRELQKKKRATLRRRFLALAACVPLALVVWFAGREAAAPKEVKLLTVVRSHALAEGMVVRTGGAVEVVRTVGGVEMVERSAEEVAMLSDAEVLELFRGQTVAIVRGTTGAKLIISEER